jgi:group I intron endonuclease
MGDYTVYRHIAPNGKMYVGVTMRDPAVRWQNGSGYPHNEYFSNAINKYGWDNFEHIIIAKGLTEDEAKWLEVELIREWNSNNSSDGYNLSFGGEGSKGCKHTEEWKQQQSKRATGEGNPFYGKQHTEETRRKMSESQKGIPKPKSEEAKRNMSKNHPDVKGKNNPRAKAIICITTKKIFNCIMLLVKIVNL